MGKWGSVELSSSSATLGRGPSKDHSSYVWSKPRNSIRGSLVKTQKQYQRKFGQNPETVSEEVWTKSRNSNRGSLDKIQKQYQRKFGQNPETVSEEVPETVSEEMFKVK